jgi:molybdate transport system substrate-binding protein
VRRATLALLAALALLLAACGDDESGAAAGRPPLTVSAAASLKQAFTDLGASYPDATLRFSFAGSDDLAAQIRQGAKPDVFAAANTKLPDELHAEGLVDEPRVFASNRLVLAVPADETSIARLSDLTRRGVTIAIGAASVPIGAYTRTVLGRLPSPERAAILRNVGSEEPDVSGIVGKLTQGAVDAGFVYRSDVRGAGSALRAIDLPDDLQPKVAYGVAVVQGSPHRDTARAFVDALLGRTGRQALREAGLDPPPRG